MTITDRAQAALVKRMAKRLKKLRATRGWTQEELAAASGVSRVHIARLEMARTDSSLGILAKLARALKVKVGDLVD